MGKIMWSQMEGLYRGQAMNGAVVTVDEDALHRALKNAGNTVFETEWWLETLNVVFEHWGVKIKLWTDPATQTLRVHYMVEGEENGKAAAPSATSGPLTTRLLNSGKLGTGTLNSDRLNSGKLRDTR